ncbi:MAG: hypothetical protein PHW83_09745 [Bacteroidales bacterium]|nr:hypothetical protein [Bacteroidales bacterium]
MKHLNFILLLLLISSTVFSQWEANGIGLNRYGSTKWAPSGNNNIKSIGIGHQEAFGGIIEGWNEDNPPQAALHVNDFYLDDPPSWVFTPGQVFRTDGPSNRDNMWQMFTGNNYDNSTEKARLSVPANSDDFVIQASQPFGTIRFRLGPMQRMILRDGLAQVHLGIGNNFSDPQHMIHVHTTPLLVGTPPPASMIGFTHNITGASATDGFLVGINTDGVAELRQQENADIVFYANNTKQLTISSDNNIKINSLSSNKKNFVIADKDGTLMLYAINTKKAKITELEARITKLEEKIAYLEENN